MAIYRFRISFEEFDDVHRDIEILSLQTFEQFHLAIQEAIGFDASRQASFFMSNDNWKKGQEIATEITDKNTPDAMLMKESRMCDFIADPHQKIYYVLTPLRNGHFTSNSIKFSLKQGHLPNTLFV